MVSPLTTDPHPGSNHPEAAASPPQGKRSGDLGLQSESGEIVVRRPVEDSVEGSLYIPVKTRVVPPPRQFAYDAPPIVESEKQIDGQLPGSVVGGEGQTDRHFAYDNPPLVGAERQLFSEFAYDASQVVADSSIGSGAVLHTDIDTPSDELPPPPPQEDFLSPNNHYQATNTPNSLNATNFVDSTHSFHPDSVATEPLAIEEKEDVSMVISPTCSVSKTPESDSAMVTSSVESEQGKEPEFC